MNQPIGLGVIGAHAQRGWARMTHLPALNESSDFEVRAVAFTSAEAAAQAATVWKAAAAYDDPADLLATMTSRPYLRDLIADGTIGEVLSTSRSHSLSTADIWSRRYADLFDHSPDQIIASGVLSTGAAASVHIMTGGPSGAGYRGTAAKIDAHPRSPGAATVGSRPCPTTSPSR